MWNPAQMDGSLMSFPRIAVLFALCLAVVSVNSKTVYADRVDDLLAGKPVVIEEQTVVGEGDESAVAETASSEDAATNGAAVKRPLPKGTLSEKSWEVTLAEPSHVGITPDQATSAAKGRTAAPPGMISVVPEPSAIALAAAALVYFLLFFRRRYSF